MKAPVCTYWVDKVCLLTKLKCNSKDVKCFPVWVEKEVYGSGLEEGGREGVIAREESLDNLKKTLFYNSHENMPTASSPPQNNKGEKNE